jgi:hypothetical protein
VKHSTPRVKHPLQSSPCLLRMWLPQPHRSTAPLRSFFSRCLRLLSPHYVGLHRHNTNAAPTARFYFNPACTLQCLISQVHTLVPQRICNTFHSRRLSTTAVTYTANNQSALSRVYTYPLGRPTRICRPHPAAPQKKLPPPVT